MRRSWIGSRVLAGAARLAAGLGLWAGCSISPQPPPPGDIGIATEAITMRTEGAGVAVDGAAGAVTPATGVLRIHNLDGADPPVEAPVAGDGSFSVTLTGVLSSSLRLQALADDEERSFPVDVVGTTEGAPVAPIEPPSPCLEIALELLLADHTLGAPIDRYEVVVTNGCDTPVTLAENAFRQGGLGAFVFIGPQAQYPLALGPGETHGIDIGFKSNAAGTYEEILVVSLESAGGPRRFVTLRGTAVE